jgi:DNA-binding response OmpR family regulator
MRDHEVDRPLLRNGAIVPGATWRGGRLSAPDRPLVYLACSSDETDMLRKAWDGQAIDIEAGTDLELALVRSGQWDPDLFVVGTTTGVIGPLDFVRTLRRAGAAAPVVVGVDGSGPPAATDSLVTDLLAAGATAVFTRPFPAEAVLRQLKAGAPVGSFRIKPLPIDLGRLRVDGTATRMWVDGVECLLPAMEHLLLRYLAERHGQIVSRDELVSAAWGQSGSTISNSLAVHLARVRRRFPAHSGVDWIKSVRGCGYQLSVPAGARAARTADRR